MRQESRITKLERKADEDDQVVTLVVDWGDGEAEDADVTVIVDWTEDDQIIITKVRRGGGDGDHLDQGQGDA